MTIVDAHVHVFADEIAPAAIESVRTALERSGHTTALDGTVGALERSMDQCHVDRVVYLPLATKSTQTEVLIQWSARLQERNPRFLCAGTLHPNNENYGELIRRMKSLGLRGVKMHPVFQNFSVLDERIVEMFRACGEEGLPVVLHAGLDILASKQADGSPTSLAKMLELCPETTFVAAHMGGSRQWDEVESGLVGKDIYLDTSLACQLMDPAQFRRIVKKHGVHRILFGSDSPWCPQQQAIDFILSCGFSEQDQRQIFSENALRVFSP